MSKFKGRDCVCGHAYEKHGVEYQGLPCRESGCICKVFRTFPQKMSGHPRFHELLAQMAATHIAKGADYSSPEDILSNLRSSEAVGVPAWLGAMIRMSDKFERIRNLARKMAKDSGAAPAVADETIEDTLIDLASYALLVRILLEDAKK